MSLAHLSQAIRADKSSGKPLPTVWTSLEEADAVFRQGTTVIVAGGSGSGKSVFALTLAVKSGASCIYFSADSGPGTQLARSASMLTGRPERDCREAIEHGYYFDKEVSELKRIRFEFNAGPDQDDILESLEAYGYLHGEYPELVICDNLMNILSDDSGEGGRVNKENVLLFLAELAREKGCCIVILHHVVGQYGDGTTPVPMSGLMEKVDKSAELILTIHQIEDPMGGVRLGVCVVKNRGGERGGVNKVIELDADFSVMQLTDQTYQNNQTPF